MSLINEKFTYFSLKQRMRMTAVDSRDDAMSSRCGHAPDTDTQSQQGSYITVIPVDYNRRSPYPTTTSDYLVDQYSEYLRERARDEYLRGDYNINSDPQYEEAGPMYTLAQRYAAAESLTNYNAMAQEREWDPRAMSQATNQIVPQATVQQQAHQEQVLNEQLAAAVKLHTQQQQQQLAAMAAAENALPPLKKSSKILSLVKCGF
jgi:hypothetical protein